MPTITSRRIKKLIVLVLALWGFALPLAIHLPGQSSSFGSEEGGPGHGE